MPAEHPPQRRDVRTGRAQHTVHQQPVDQRVQAHRLHLDVEIRRAGRDAADQVVADLSQQVPALVQGHVYECESALAVVELVPPVHAWGHPVRTWWCSGRRGLPDRVRDLAAPSTVFLAVNAEDHHRNVRLQFDSDDPQEMLGRSTVAAMDALVDYLEAQASNPSARM